MVIQTNVPPKRSSFAQSAFGAIGSREKVIADAVAVTHFLEECPRLVAFAMEGAGSLAQLRNHFTYLPLEIRGVCGYADEQTNDSWQFFAAEMTSAFAVELLRSCPILSSSLRKRSQAFSEQQTLQVFCTQSLRVISPIEIYASLSQRQKLSSGVEYIALDWTDIEPSRIATPTLIERYSVW